MDRPPDHRQIVRMLACARIAIGATLLAAPRRAGGRWIGPAADDAAARLAVRALAARDLAIGVGTLRALTGEEPARPWAVAGAASDLVDAAATIVAVRQVGLRRALPAIVIALGAGIYTLSIAEQIDSVDR
jgi:hypothetical protein